MSNETVVRVSADATGYTSEMDRARRSAEAFAASQEAVARRTQAAQAGIEEAVANSSQAGTRQINAFMQSLVRQADTAGKTRAELLQMQAAALGVSDSAQQYIDKIADASKHTEEFSIKTAGARRELLVLAHEASQGNWKNFGGSLMVLGERTDAMSKILSPVGMGIGVVVAAIAALAVAIHKGAAESDALNAALKNTGNYAGMTAGQVNDLAVSIGSIQGGTTEAQKVLTGLISTGRFSGDTLTAVAKSVIAMSDATGESADKVIEQYVKMSDGVTKWAEEQNKQYHFLTLAEYDHIKALEESGAQAAAEAQVADQLTEALGKQHTALGWLPAAWKAVGDAASSAWREMMNLGKPTSAEAKLGALQQELAQAQVDMANGGTSASADGVSLFASKDDMQGRIKQLQSQIANQQAFVDNEQKFAAQQAENSRVHQAAIDADNALSKSMESLDKDYAKSEAMRKLYQQFVALKKEYENTGVMPSKYEGVSFNVHTGDFSGGLYDKAAADITDRYKGKAAHTNDNGLNADLAALQNQQKMIEDATRASLEHIKALRAEGVISEQDALAQSYIAEQSALQKRIDIDKQQEAIAEGKKNKEAYRKYADDIQRLQQQMTANYAKFGDDIGKMSKKEADAVQVFTDGLMEQLKTQQTAADTKLTGLSMGTNDRADFDTQIRLMEDYDKKSAALKKSLSENRIGKDQYDAELAATKDYYSSAVAIAQKSSADIIAANKDWTIGAARAMADYSDSANNVAAQTVTTFQDGFKGMEDALVSFATTGKLSFTSLANSIIADIIRMQARAAISGLFSAAVSAVGGYFGNGFATTAANIQGGNSLDNLVNNTGGWGTIPARATGGPVDAGTTYLVGEKGPELFNPGTSGTIIPNHAITSSSGGGDLTVNVPVSIEGSGSATDQSNAGDLGAKIRQAVQAVLQNERRQGGVLWKVQNGIA